MSKKMVLIILISSSICALLLSQNKIEPAKLQSKVKRLKSVPVQQVKFSKAHKIMKRSCMPCHNKHRVNCLVQAIKRLDFQAIDGETKPRIIGAIDGLSEMIKEGMLLSFTSEKEVKQFLKSMPGGMYTMVDKGVMPPPWAPELMNKLYLHQFRPLSSEDRRVLQIFALKNTPGG